MIENNTTAQLERKFSANATNIAIESSFGGFTSSLHANFGGPAALLPDGSRAYCDDVPKYMEWAAREGARRDGVLAGSCHSELRRHAGT